MRQKLLTINDYFNHFNFQEYGTGCGVETEPHSGENYLWAQTFLPKDYFIIDNPSLILNPFLELQVDYIPDQVQIKFELFAIGQLDDIEAFIFKPWVVNIDNPMLFQFLEGFHLYVPSTLFYNLIDRLLFLEQLDQSDFKYIRILQDLPSNTFQRFGLDRQKVPKDFMIGSLLMSRLIEVDKTEISKFYSDNWQNITHQLEEKYFRPLLNTWFRITIEDFSSELFGLEQSLINKTVGFIRLYNKAGYYTGGASIEFIIGKVHRNKGYASLIIFDLIQYLKKNSYAITLEAEVKDNNEISKKVLKCGGFMEHESNTFNDANFGRSLLDNLEDLEEDFEAGRVNISVINIYARKYSRYF